MGETLYRKGGCADMEKRMEDEKIIQLIWDREEQGLRELSDKYNNYCYSISYRIVHDEEDAMECVNDTWFRTWNAIPPKRPAVLPGSIARFSGKDCSKSVVKQIQTYAYRTKRGK